MTSEPQPGTLAPEPPTSWFGVALGRGLGALAAYHLFKLPPVLPILLQKYDYGLLAAGSFIARQDADDTSMPSKGSSRSSNSGS